MPVVQSLPLPVPRVSVLKLGTRSICALVADLSQGEVWFHFHFVFSPPEPGK